MNLNIRPILSALLRNRAGAVLVSVQIAIALAVMTNAVYIVKQRLDYINRPTGFDIANILVVASTGFRENFDYEASLTEDLTYLRSVPGVIAASATNAAPLSGSGSASDFSAHPLDRTHAATGIYYEMDEQSIDTLGVRLVAGRKFRREEILPPRPGNSDSSVAPSAIVTRALAKDIFNTDDVVGKVMYDINGRPMTVVGVMDHMLGAWVSFKSLDHVFITPRYPVGPAPYYLVRVQPGRLNEILRTVEEHMSNSNPNRVITSVRPLQYYKDNSYLSDRNTTIFLISVTALLLAITALGIFGLATFNVSTRTKQIGTRRALGARKRDILQYFLVENALITFIGIVVGCALALGVGLWLSHQYQLPRLDLYYLVGGWLVLAALGQLAVWQPARRASTVSPAVATRNV